MSMSQANAALMLDVYAETARLGITLSEAERMVDQSTKRMEKKVDGSFGQVGNKITKMLSAAVGAGLAIKVMDDALRKVAEGLENSQGVKEIGAAIGNGVVEAIRSVPVVGGLMDVASQLGDIALGGPLAMERAQADARTAQLIQQQQRAAAPGAMRELEMTGATGANLDRLRREQELARLTAIGKRAKAGRTQIVDGVEMELEEGILASVASAIAAGMKAFDDQVAAKRSQELEKIAQERKRAEERMREEQERADAAEMKRQREQEDAYERFVEGNARDAIMAIEAQLESASAAMAPSRAQRLMDLMETSGATATADTVLGGFTYAVGDAAQVSQNILAKAEAQLAVLEKIEALQEEANRIAQESGLR